MFWLIVVRCLLDLCAYVIKIITVNRDIKQQWFSVQPRCFRVTAVLFVHV